ncbi:MAG: NAD(P)-dependent oxidoreductase [Candidatus Omnitrophota bacterium]
MKFKRILSRLGLLLLFFSAFADSAEIKEIAPGVYFRPAVAVCNIGWIVFKDYVLVVDASIPGDAEKAIEDIRKTTDKPIRFVFDTHHHWDHSYGNAVFAKAGASIIAQRECWETLKGGVKDFAEWAKDKPDYLARGLAQPSVIFDDIQVFDDGEKRVELLWFGHAHTKGDAVAYLPKEKILFTGDLCVNGVFNYLGESNLENWIAILSHLQGLDIETVCPGHGETAGKDLLETQKEYFVQLRKEAQKAVDDGLTLEQALASIRIPMYEKWTGRQPQPANIEYAYRYAAGMITPWPLLEHGFEGGPSPTKDTPGWTPPKKMLTSSLSEKQLAALKRVAPDMEFVNIRNDDEILEKIGDVDAAMTPLTPEQFHAAKKLRLVISQSAGVDKYLIPEFVNSDVILTNGQGMMGPAISDHVMGFVLMFTKALAAQHEQKLNGKWGWVKGHPITELKGKTMLILGLGGIGREVAARAKGFGMIVKAVDPKPMEKPHFISYIGQPQELHNLLPQADVVACCVPLTPKTRRYFGKQEFELMNPTAYFVNIGRGEVVNQDDLVEALRNKTIAGAGLDVTDPEPLPPDHPLWKLDNVIITPHMSGWTDESWNRRWLILRENVRRFAVGEPLLNVVNKEVGY